MNEDLLQLIRYYAVKGHSEIRSNLIGKSKDNLISMLMDLLTMYYNDMTSATLRELVVATLSGYQPNTEKVGYRGFRQDALTGATEYCEIKPVNVRSGSIAKVRPKLNGGGSFTDYSWGKFNQHTSESPNMLVAGFVDGRLIYIFEFNFNEQSFVDRLQLQLNRRFPDGQISGEYLRSASFSFVHFRDSPSLKTTCFVSLQDLTDLHTQKHITKTLFTHLQGFIK